MPKRTIEFDGPSEKFWVNGRNGEQYLFPRSQEEARNMGLYFDHASGAWWDGHTLVARPEEIERCNAATRHALIRTSGWEEEY